LRSPAWKPKGCGLLADAGRPRRVEERVAASTLAPDDSSPAVLRSRSPTCGHAARARSPRTRAPRDPRVGDLSSTGTHRAWRGGEVELRASDKEVPALLDLFWRRPVRCCPVSISFSNCWYMAYDNRSNVINRAHPPPAGEIDWPFGRSSIETVRAAGYRLRTARHIPRAAFSANPSERSSSLRRCSVARRRSDSALQPPPASLDGRLDQSLRRANPARSHQRVVTQADTVWRNRSPGFPTAPVPNGPSRRC